MEKTGVGKGAGGEGRRMAFYGCLAGALRDVDREFEQVRRNLSEKEGHISDSAKGNVPVLLVEKVVSACRSRGVANKGL